MPGEAPVAEDVGGGTLVQNADESVPAQVAEGLGGAHTHVTHIIDMYFDLRFLFNVKRSLHLCSLHKMIEY